MKIIAALALMSLAGCYGPLSTTDVHMALTACETFGGIKTLDRYGDFTHSFVVVKCIDGKSITFDAKDFST